jgi:glycosyltransferase involved in cell wall biosynthesis
VIASIADTDTPEQQLRLKNELQDQQLDSSLAKKLIHEPEVRATVNGIDITSVRDLPRNFHVVSNRVSEWRPDWVLVSSEDLSHTLLRHAARIAPGRMVYLGHTPQWFPFGPAAWNRDKDAANAVRNAAAIIVISEAMAAYVERHLGRRPLVVHPPIYGLGPWPSLGRFDGYIGMINPCAVKGIATFLALADVLPDRKFAALPGWGTTRHDLESLKRRKNIAMLPRVRTIDLFLQRLSVLLMPSIWLEGFGLVVMEAMLRGIPVISSDSDGLREAKAGTRFVIPVRIVERYEQVYDDRNMPRPVLPPHGIEPWVMALHELTKSRDSYDQEARREKEAAVKFVQGVDRGALERALEGLPTPPELPRGKIKPILSQLSEAKRELLLKRLRARADEKK